MSVRTVIKSQPAWVLGSGGLLGSALVRRAAERDVDIFTATRIPWSDSQDRAHALAEAARQFAAMSADAPMVVVWAAGIAGVSSDQATADSETQALSELIEALAPYWAARGGVFFLASSAGAVYAASDNAPFDSSSPTAANSPYGRAKLAQEDLLIRSLPENVRVVVGRLGNLYGPPSHGRHGLISRLSAAALSRSALNLFVSLDTLRDYCWADDAAELIWRDVLSESRGSCVRVIGSGQAVTISEVVSTVQSVTHRRVPIALGTDPESERQPIDLRLVPDWLDTYPDFQPLDLASGIKRLVTELATAPR